MSLRRVLALALLAGVAVPVAVTATEATFTPTCITVESGRGWNWVANQFAPTIAGAARDAFVQRIWAYEDNSSNLTAGELVCIDPNDPALTPTTSTSVASTSTSSSLPSTTSTSTTIPTVTSTTLPTTSSSTSTTVPATTPTPTTLPPGTCSGAQHTPGGPDRWGGCWPGTNNTGVPAGTTLTAYTGPCTITTAGTVIDGKTVNCDLDINAANVTIRRSRINGTIHTNSTGTVLADIFVNASPNGPSYWSGVEGSNYTATRVHTIGGIRGFWCEHNCVIQDSYIHGQVVTADWHAGGIRLSQNGRLTHNTIWCEPQPTPQDGGCSADLTGYPDFEPYNHNTVERNLLMANPTGISYCMYGGGSGPKPYTNDPTNATYVVVRDNVWQRGSNGKCGAYGPVTDYITGRVGNVWSGNQWDNGSTVPPG